MRTLMLTFILTACGGNVPHLIALGSGEDLGPSIDYVSRSSLYAPVGAVVDWSWERRIVFYSGPTCSGAAGVDALEKVDAFPHPLDGLIYRREGAPHDVLLLSYVNMVDGEARCYGPDVSPPREVSVRSVVPTGVAGRPYAPDEIAVELR